MNSPASCGGCATQLGTTALACPACGRLVHGERLRELAAAAERAESEGRAVDALSAWREAADLLPEATTQQRAVGERIQRLSRRVDRGGPPPAASPARRGGAWGLLGIGALFLWKFKAVVLALLGKLKFLALGLKQMTTFFSMLLSFGVYWTAFGWSFAAGLVISIYIHEIGHVDALRRFGIKATAPMFIPGFGALVRLQQSPANAIEDARVGLAGPLWGLGAALAAWGLGLLTGAPYWLAIARTGAWINLFNLLPFWQLDGSRGMRALSRPQRWILIAGIALAFAAFREGLLLILLVVAVVRAFGRDEHPAGDPTALVHFLLLLGALAALTRLPVRL